MTTPPSNPLAHFEFDYLDTDGEYEALLNKEMEYFENESAKLPLIVPDPPPGISEFSMIRYLFCNVCYVSEVHYADVKQLLIEQVPYFRISRNLALWEGW